MPRTPPGKSVLLLMVASVLALLVGLVGSGERPASPRPPPPPAEPSRVGRVRVPLAIPATPAPVEVEIEVEPRDVRSRPVDKPAGSTRDPRRRLTGIVLSPEGEPAAGARVVLGQQQATCDADGRFELALAPVPSGADLLAFAPGHEPALQPDFGARLGRSGDQTVRLVLGPQTLTLSGTVAGPDGQPRKGWTVELDGPDVLTDFGLRDVVRTGADGGFVLTDVPAGVHVLRAWKERRELAFRSVPATAGESGITIAVSE